MARILVIDDESNIRLMVRIALQAAGHQVETAADGSEGLDKFGTGEGWDMVLLDQRMPGLDGLQVLEAMRPLCPDARVILITAFGTIDLARDALRLGAVGFLRKPFTTDALRGAVRMALETSAPAASSTWDAPSEPRSSGDASINGFRIIESAEPSASQGGEIRQSFTVRGPSGQDSRCEVLLPAYFTHLVRAHADCEAIPDEAHFWPWLCEEALANYLWQNAELPPDGFLAVNELSTSLARWVDAILPR